MIGNTNASTAVEVQSDMSEENPAGHPFLFNEHNLEKYKRAIEQGIDLVRRNIAATDKPFSGVLPHELAPRFRGVDLDRPAPDLTAALKEIERLYLEDAVYFHHPRYVAHLNCPITVPAILAELIATSINSSLDTWDQSAGATFIEQKLIDWTAEKVGLGSRADGIFTSGGTQSNLMALLLARDNHFIATKGHHAVKNHGLPAGHEKLRILTSEASHFSVQKAAGILGLGHDAVIPVPFDHRFRMDPHRLEEEMGRCIDQGLVPFAVVATAGTTDFGSIDPLPVIAAICRRHRVWMHVDAAYGCGLLVSRHHRGLLSGVEHADSVTVDYHKSFFQPVSCGAFLVREQEHLACVTCRAEYLNPAQQLREGTPNLVDKSIQTTRRFDALKLWLTLRTMGPDQIGRGFDRVIKLADQAYRMLRSEGAMEVLHQPELSTLVFRYRPPSDHPERVIDKANAYIRKSLFRSGEAVVASTKVGGRRYLKFTLLNPETTIDDLRRVVHRIKAHGARFLHHRSAVCAY